MGCAGVAGRSTLNPFRNVPFADGERSRYHKVRPTSEGAAGVLVALSIEL